MFLCWRHSAEFNVPEAIEGLKRIKPWISDSILARPGRYWWLCRIVGPPPSHRRPRTSPPSLREECRAPARCWERQSRPPRSRLSPPVGLQAASRTVGAPMSRAGGCRHGFRRSPAKPLQPALINRHQAVPSPRVLKAASRASKCSAISAPVAIQTSPLPSTCLRKSRRMCHRIGRPETWG